MYVHRDWREQLSGIWPEWDRRMEEARRQGLSTLPELPFPAPAQDENGETQNLGREEEDIAPESWIAIPECWVHMSRGLGDYARFALLRYLRLPNGATAFDPESVGRLSTEEWVGLVAGAVKDEEFLTRGKQGWFDSQVRDLVKKETGDWAFDKRAKRLKPLFDDKRLWEALAQAANTYLTLNERRGRTAVTAEILRNGRFSGPMAIVDFITYLNTGTPPARQSPFADELADLGVAFPKDFTSTVKFFESDARLDLIAAVAIHLADPDVDGFKSGGACGITSLWSRLQPHGLIATCEEVVKKYSDLCTRGDLRRLPIVYVPVGLDSKRQYVSRRAVVRDMYAKLRIARARARGEAEIPRELAANPTGEAVDRAIGEIRTELATHPTLLIFGIHQVTPITRFGAIAEEILDAPLHFIIDRLMTETGDFGKLTQPRNAYASRYLILADGELQTIANLKVEAFKLPQCPPEKFESLIHWTKVPQLQALRAASGLTGEPLTAITSNEIELLTLEAILTFDARAKGTAAPGELARRAIQLVWGPTALEYGKERTAKLLAVLIEHLIQRARVDSEAAWFATILHVVALLPGGIRLFTVARALTGYVTATLGGRLGPDEPPEADLWSGTVQDLSSRSRTQSLSDRVCEKVLQFEALAAGLVRSFPSAAAAGFDEYDHPFESPEVPAFEPRFPDNRLQLEFISPYMRRVICERFRHHLPEKHALLNRSIAEEFIRRAAIVQCHCQEKDVRSLVDKRYVVIAIHCALESLTPGTNKLVTAAGAVRLRWRIPAHSRIKAYHWIYRWLYVEQLNSNEQALSQEYGAELLKRALLEEFLDSDPLQAGPVDRGFLRHPASRNALEHFGIVTDIFHGLIYVSVRTSNAKLALDTFERLDGLVRLVKEETRALASEWQSQWQRALRKVAQDTLRLRLDATLSYEAAFSGPKAERLPWSLKNLRQSAVDVLADSSPQLAGSAARILHIIRKAIRRNRGAKPELWRFGPPVSELRALIPEDTVQHFYSYLCRFAELFAATAESMGSYDRSARRRKLTLILFELAETLRIRSASGPFRERVLKFSSRSLRNAARVCLSLGRYFGEDWYYERAAHYCFHVVGNKPQRIERIALLITQAIAIRFRAASSEQLSLAMKYLKTAERALIHYPDRTQLWMRFYLERAKLFREWAQQPDVTLEEARKCVFYCRADVAALRRLAQKRQAWLARAARVLESLPELPAGSSTGDA